MMKGISLHGKLSKFSNNKLHLYRNPILDLCCVLQYGSPNRFHNMKDVWNAMHVLKCKRLGLNNFCSSSMTINVAITLDQSIFKREIAKVFTDNFVLSKSMNKLGTFKAWRFFQRF